MMFTVVNFCTRTTVEIKKIDATSSKCEKNLIKAKRLAWYSDSSRRDSTVAMREQPRKAERIAVHQTRERERF